MLDDLFLIHTTYLNDFEHSLSICSTRVDYKTSNLMKSTDSAFNESESEKLPQGPPLKFDSASFGGISQNRK